MESQPHLSLSPPSDRYGCSRAGEFSSLLSSSVTLYFQGERVPLINSKTSHDPQLLSVASKFVAEIIEKAKTEAAIRLKKKKQVK